MTVAPGESVKFSYPSGASTHNVVFNDAQPASCVQSSAPNGLPTFEAPPLPKFVEGPGWSGQCRFDTPGTYTFRCSVHPEMTGTVVVAASRPAATPTATPSATVSAVEPPAPDALPAAVPSAWAVIDRPRKLASTVAALIGRHLSISGRCVSVNAGTVRLTVSAATARELKLKRRTLATATAHCRGDGQFVVAIRPTAAATRALRRYGRALDVTATLRMRGTHGTVDYHRHVQLAGRGKA